MNEQLLNFTEAQKMLGVSRSTLLRWLKSKKISGYKAGKKWKFYRRDLSKIIVKEKPAVYSASEKKTYKILKPLLPAALKIENIFSQNFWCEWQDAEEWLYISIIADNMKARIQTSSGTSVNLPVSSAREITSVWESWSSASSRPSKFSVITDGKNFKISTFQLPAKIERSAPTSLSKKILMKSYCDIYISSPPSRSGARRAYSILLQLIGQTSSVFTNEFEPTYFLPGALQFYDIQSRSAIGFDCSLVQLSPAAALPARCASSPRFRIAYSFSALPPEINKNKDVIVI